MSDIVERLRIYASQFEDQHAPDQITLAMRAGADEIERLRAGGCARDQGTTQYCAEAVKKDAEIASLLNLLADARTESMKLRADLCAANGDLNSALTDRTHDLTQIEQNAEYIKRLRAALEPEFLGKLIYETWIKAADGPEWLSYAELAHLAPDDAVAIQEIVEAIRIRAALGRAAPSAPEKEGE